MSNAYYPGSGSIVYFLGGSAGGFTATASGATDADSGILSYGYSSIGGAGWSNVGNAYTFTGISPTGTGSVTATNNAGLTGASASFTAQSDTNAPAGGAFNANGTAATGVGTSSYLNSGTTLTITGRTDYTETQSATESGLATSTLTMATGTLSGNSCSGYGAPATITGMTAQTVASGNCYLLTLTGLDNVGNAASISTTVKVDTTAPSAPAGFSFGSLTNSYYPGSGSIVYFKSGTAGGFTTTASGATDADTSIASYNYGAIAGAGWVNVGGGAYTFTAASPTGIGSVTATNLAGLTGASASFTAQSDSTAPTGGAFTANGVAASGSGTTSYLTTSGTHAHYQLPHRLHRDPDRDRVRTRVVDADHPERRRSPATRAGATAAPTTIAGTDHADRFQWQLLPADPHRHSTTSATAPPSARWSRSTRPLRPRPTGFSFSGLTNAYYPGSGTTVYFKGGSAGGFTATGSGSTDADTGISGYSYGNIAGTGWSNAAGAYTFTAASPSGSGAVTATNNAGLIGSSASFTATADSTAPASGAFTANSVVATSGGSSSYLSSGTTLTINSRTDYTDGGSGLASSTLTMATGTLSGNTCSAYGAPASITGTTSQTVASGHCYLLTLTGTDNVGNTDSISTTVMVDTTAPSAPTGIAFSAPTNAFYPGSGLDRLLQGRRRRRLHRHRLGRHRRRLGHRRLHLPGTRSELGERRRCLYVQRDRCHAVRVGHRTEQRRTYRLRLDLHRPGRHERADRRRVHRQRAGGLRSAAPRAISRRGRR